MRHYNVASFQSEAGGKVWRLTPLDGGSFDGEGSYDMHSDGGLWLCECRDYVFRHENKGTDCKHLAALRALGVIE